MLRDGLRGCARGSSELIECHCACCELFVEGSVVTIAGAGAAESAAVERDFAFEIDAFAALVADDARTFEAGEIFGVNFHANPLLVE